MVHAISLFSDDSRGVAQPGSATVLGTVGREFESRRPDHSENYYQIYEKDIILFENSSFFS